MQDFPGAIVLVSHDRYFLGQITNLLIGLDGTGKVGLFADIEQWEDTLKQSRTADKFDSSVDSSAGNTKSVSRPKSSTKRLSYLEQREYDGMEAAIAAAEAALEAAQSKAEDPSVVTSALKSTEAFAELEKAQGKVDHLYARWAELESKLT